MIVAGDELGQTQRGNNNPYCQDNEISWIDWEDADQNLLAFTQQLIHLRKKHPVFRRLRWFQGKPIKGVGVEDIAWFQPHGAEMNEENWNSGFAKSLGVYLNGRGIDSISSKGETVIDDSFYVIFNGYHEPLSFKLPPIKYGLSWSVVLDTSKNIITEEGETYKAEDELKVDGRSVVVLTQPMHQTGQ